MRMITALLLLSGALAPRAMGAEETRAPEAAPAPTAPAPTTFEALAEGAAPAVDMPTLLAPLVDKCGEGARDDRELDRARCRAAQAYLRRTLPQRSFSIGVADPAAISLSAYDPTLKGFRIGLSACVACASPLAIGRAAQPFLVTLKKPVEAAGAKPAGDKPEDALAASTEVATATVGFASEAEANRWLREIRPRLRASFIFKPAATEWRFRGTRGYAVEMLAGRIVDPCTGTVILSSPPSTGDGERVALAGCPIAKRAPVAPVEGFDNAESTAPPSDDDDQPQLPIELSRNAIAQAMGQIRSQVFACFQRFGVPGTAPLTYEIAGNGSVQSVRLDGTLNGTPTGTCIVEAARNARFPHFDGPVQTFSYPFFLRR
jgi:hypothetical protein